MIKVKDGNIRMGGLRPEILFVLMVASSIWESHGADLVITGHGPEGMHSWGSLHYVWLAVDLRRWNLSDPRQATKELGEALGPDYDVVLEDTHVHVEFQPKQSYV